jgi:dTDP-4-amino-4,6-dideoxygalactose transaminase
MQPFSHSLGQSRKQSAVQPGAGLAVAFNKPAFLGPELEEITKALRDYRQISGGGPFTQQCEQWLSSFYDSPTLLTSSCTHALEMAAILLNVGLGDEVIVPSFTFVSTANAFALRGATLRFADCDGFGQLCLEHVRRLITPKTKAICVVHYAGHSTDMEALSRFCKEKGIALVEDAAQAIGTRYQDRLLGTWGDLACLSFHETKNITSGEGGALIINQATLLDRAHHIREKGTNRAQFIQGLVDKYTWVDLGSSYIMSDLNAAHLWVQLQRIETIQTQRKTLWERYAAELSPPEGGSTLLIPPGNTSNHHLFALIFENPKHRAAFIQYMFQCRITAPFHYVALHDSPYGQTLPQPMPANPIENFTQTIRLAQGLVRLPLFYNMTDAEQDWVITCVQRFFQRMGNTEAAT